MPNRPERYSANCQYCFVELEAKSVKEAIERAEEHEKTCADNPANARPAR